MENEAVIQWIGINEAWRNFCAKHPELEQKPEQWSLTNVLRTGKPVLIKHDAIRKVRGRHWIAQPEKFNTVMFDWLTGKDLEVQS